MGELKTKPTDASIPEIIGEIEDEARRRDALALIDMMRRVTGSEPTRWSNGAIGFGTYRYRYSSGQEGEWFPVGFASRKANIAVYLGPGLDWPEELLGTLGTYTTGKGCLYIKRLSDVDLAVLEALIADSYARIRQLYG